MQFQGFIILSDIRHQIFRPVTSIKLVENVYAAFPKWNQFYRAVHVVFDRIHNEIIDGWLTVYM